MERGGADVICEMPQVYGCEMPVARKDHRCCECDGVIKKGEKYHRHHGIWEGEANTYKVCLECELIRGEVDKNIGDPTECTGFGELIETVAEIRDTNLLHRYVQNAMGRGAAIPAWILQRSRG